MKIFLLVFVALCSFAAFVRYLESNSIFHPTRDVLVDPSSIGLTFEDVYFKTKDGLKLNGWFLKNASAPSTLIYFHGNAGNISHRLEKIEMFHALGLNVFIIDYRGYGKSEGRPSEKGLYHDTLAAYDYLISRRDVDPEKLISYGDSLGGVFAIYLASQRKVKCLIADSSFSSSADVAKAIFPFVPAFLLATKMDSAARVKNLAIPKLFIHSINDEIIPYALGEKLFEAACPPKENLKITGGHNTNHIDSQESFIGGIKTFLSRLNLI